MTGNDWLVDNHGQCSAYEITPTNSELSHPYWLYRFLSDLEDTLTQISDDRSRLEAIRILVRQLLNNSPWLDILSLEPNPETGWEVLTLYDEPFFPLTVQLVAWSVGSTSPIHNHGCWGVVALLKGQEKNSFWQRSPTPELPDQIRKVGDRLLVLGDILCLMPAAIHHVEAIGDEPTLSFNLYGETNYSQRFQFDLGQGTAKNF
jgi:predicted metal-dependent enzyme (double-stranded beta helix superfamily)